MEHDERWPDRHARACQELRRIGALIAALPAKCREAFVLRKVQGLSQREIAGRMRISENTVEKHVGKGLRLLMRSLARDADAAAMAAAEANEKGWKDHRSDEHTSELQSLMRISYAVFCLKKKEQAPRNTPITTSHILTRLLLEN